MIDYAEKRDFLRMPIDCALSFTVAGENRAFQGSVINLSHRGILFTSTDGFAEGTRLDIVLTPANSLTPPMEAEVVVARITDNDSVYEIACEIANIKS